MTPLLILLSYLFAVSLVCRDQELVTKVADFAIRRIWR